MHVKSLKYTTPFTIFIASFFALTGNGWIIFIPLVYVWVLIPLIELFQNPDNRNLEAAEEELARHDRSYDIWLYLVVLFQYAALYLFLRAMQQTSGSWWELSGKVLVMGLLCGTFGINVAHELGHRSNRSEQFLAKLLLLSSLYMHFFIEHNKGHHKRVSTPEDPASARYGESVYAFYFRSVLFSYISAWQIANREMKKKGLPVFHWKNEMLQYQFIQLGFVVTIGLIFGWRETLFFVVAALIGALLLETVNYIEHYGLERKKKENGSYERAMPEHSWNSNHVIGRIVLFELSRHSDHHYIASRKYQVLRHHDGAPQMPTGYPGMMILSLLTPAWYAVMNPRVKKIREHSS
ncbi:MAG TPA: alkane 1-monooxygenase [Chitinophagaceae bacterium]|nr:alkane 1-monooxygenase [Chitinophagaceae bacterium]